MISERNIITIKTVIEMAVRELVESNEKANPSTIDNTKKLVFNLMDAFINNKLNNLSKDTQTLSSMLQLGYMDIPLTLFKDVQSVIPNLSEMDSEIALYLAKYFFCLYLIFYFKEDTYFKKDLIEKDYVHKMNVRLAKEWDALGTPSALNYCIGILSGFCGVFYSIAGFWSLYDYFNLDLSHQRTPSFSSIIKENGFYFGSAYSFFSYSEKSLEKNKPLVSAKNNALAGYNPSNLEEVLIKIT